MGCDIHLVLEKYDDNLCEWVGIHDYNLPPSKSLRSRVDPDIIDNTYFKVSNRNYNFFANLAGVRAVGSHNYPKPKGIPATASSLTLHKHSQWEHDAHSASWMSLKEFTLIYAREVKENLDELVAERISNGDMSLTWDMYQEVAGRYLFGDENVDNYRIVFWFDN